MTELQSQQSRRDAGDVAAGLLVGLVAIGFLVGHLRYGVDWQNPPVVAWLGVVTPVCLGLATFAFGLVTGDYHRRKATYLGLFHRLGTIALLAAGLLVALVFLA